MTRSARSTWNYLTVIAFSAISMLLALITTPILLRHLGDARLGASRAVLDWAGYLTLLELGLGGALAPLLARRLASDDPNAAAGMLAAGFRAYLKVAIGMIAGGVILVACITRLIRIDPIYFRDLRGAALIACVPLLLMPLSPLRALIDANQRGYVLNLMLIGQSVVIAVVAVLLAKAGFGITGQLIAIAIGACVFSGSLLFDALLHYRRYLPHHPFRAPTDASRALWSLNTPTLVLNACGRVGLLTDNIIIGSLIGAGAIVPFLMTQRLAQMAQAQLQSIGSATWAGLAQLHAQGEDALFRKRFIELTQLVTILGLIVLVPILAYDRAFVTLWLGEAQFAGVTLIALASVNALLVAVQSLWGWAFAGTGQTARLVPVATSAAILNIAISLLFTRWYSHADPHRALWGPVLGTTCASVLVNLPFLPMLLRRHFGIPIRSLAMAMVKPMAVAAPYAAGVIWLAARYPPRSWIMLACEMAIAGAFFALVSWIVLLTVEDRANWKLRLRLATGAPAVNVDRGFEVIR